MLGRWKWSAVLWHESTCQPDATRLFAEQLMDAVSRIDGEIEAVETDELANELADATIPADPDVKNYSYTLVEDKGILP